MNTVKPTIFVVEDDPAVRNSLKFALELEDYRVQLYADGNTLLQAGDLMHARCFIVDLNLPGMNGLELLAELRRRSVRAPAVLITSDPSQYIRALAARDGVSIVEKPLLGNALSDSIRRAVAASSPGRA